MSTGLQLTLIKSHEDDDTVEYRYFVDPGCGGVYVPSPTGRPGVARLNKQSGHVEDVAACPDDRGQVLFGKAGYTMRRHWRQGHFPSSLLYAS